MKNIIKISSEFIKLDQFLKFANIVGSGGMAKEFIINGEVMVDGEVEVRRGRKLYPGTTVEFEGEEYLVDSDS